MAKRTRQQVQTLVSVLTLGVNIQKNGVEIRFPADPGDEVRGILTENGWRFNPYGAGEVKWQDPPWYKRLTPEVLKFARNLVQLLGGVDNSGPALAALEAAAQPVPPVPAPPPLPPAQLEAARALTQSRSAVLPNISPAIPAQMTVVPASASAAPVDQGVVEIKVPALA